MYFGLFGASATGCWDWSETGPNNYGHWATTPVGDDPNGDGLWGNYPAFLSFTGIAAQSPGVSTQDYRPVYDASSGCMWALGDDNVLYNFNIDASEAPCNLVGVSLDVK